MATQHVVHNKHDKGNKSIFLGREHELPVPVLTRKLPHVLEVGMACTHPHVPDERWTIVSISANGYWCRAVKGRNDAEGRIEQSFPCDVLLPYARAERSTVTRPVKPVMKDPKASAAPRAKRAAAPPKDSIAQRLSEFDSLDELWVYATKSGLPKDLRQRLQHLNPGLQRMNIGNRLRGLAAKANVSSAPKAKAKPAAKRRNKK